jgi:hypothetical protein
MGELLAIVVAAVLQPIPDPLLARFAGQWSGEGPVLEMPASVQLTWEWMLGGQFLRLTFVNQMGPSRRFEGHAYYRALGGGRCRGTWFDNSGMIRPIDASQVGESMVAKWGTAETELGETTYRLMPDGSMEIVDRVQGRAGCWRDFGRVVVRRARDSSSDSSDFRNWRKINHSNQD